MEKISRVSIFVCLFICSFRMIGIGINMVIMLVRMFDLIMLYLVGIVVL